MGGSPEWIVEAHISSTPDLRNLFPRSLVAHSLEFGGLHGPSCIRGETRLGGSYRKKPPSFGESEIQHAFLPHFSVTPIFVLEKNATHRTHINPSVVRSRRRRHGTSRLNIALSISQTQNPPSHLRIQINSHLESRYGVRTLRSEYGIHSSSQPHLFCST